MILGGAALGSVELSGLIPSLIVIVPPAPPSFSYASGGAIRGARYRPIRPLLTRQMAVRDNRDLLDLMEMVMLIK